MRKRSQRPNSWAEICASFTMRFLPIILVLPLLTGCVVYPVIWPYSSTRTTAVSGTLLDERTRTPVSGADVFFTFDPKLRCKSDKDGKFGISATRYHYWVTWETPAGESMSGDPPLPPEIMITHTNWATRQIQWDQSPQTILLQKLAVPSDPRPWLTFDGNGAVLQDGGAVRYLAQKPVMTIPGLAPRPILVQHHSDGTLQLINVPFTQRVYDPQLTISRGPDKASFAVTAEAGFSWSFWPRPDWSTNLIRVEDKSCVYKLYFIR